MRTCIMLGMMTFVLVTFLQAEKPRRTTQERQGKVPLLLEQSTNDLNDRVLENGA